MMKQIDIFIDKIDTSLLWSDISVKIHGYIMSKIPTEYATELHEKSVMPFSIYTVDMGDYFITRISALNIKAESIFSIFKENNKIRIFGSDDNMTIGKIEEYDRYSLDELCSFMSSSKYLLEFRTPAMYKSQGNICYCPTLTQYFESVRQKLLKFEEIQISREEMEAAFSKIKILEYDIKTKFHLSGGKKVPGMVGKFIIQLPQGKEDLLVLKTLLSYATYSGVGGQTTQGMGGLTTIPYNVSKHKST